MAFTITKAAIEDANRLNELVNSAYRGETSRQGWTTEADLLDGTRITSDLLTEILSQSNTTILKYEENGRLMACVELRIDNGKLYLGMLTVSPGLQGKGIGKILMKAAEEEATKMGCSAIYMTVIASRMELIDWYKRQGYQETGERKPFNFPDKRWGIPKAKLEFIVLEKLMIK
jgi:ribosomal protein S18 acetylase RimI-like enzyme